MHDRRSINGRYDLWDRHRNQVNIERIRGSAIHPPAPWIFRHGGGSRGCARAGHDAPRTQISPVPPTIVQFARSPEGAPGGAGPPLKPTLMMDPTGFPSAF